MKDIYAIILGVLTIIALVLLGYVGLIITTAPFNVGIFICLAVLLIFFAIYILSIKYVYKLHKKFRHPLGNNLCPICKKNLTSKLYQKLNTKGSQSGFVQCECGFFGPFSTLKGYDVHRQRFGVKDLKGTIWGKENIKENFMNK